jgi:hypothetical protein
LNPISNGLFSRRPIQVQARAVRQSLPESHHLAVPVHQRGAYARFAIGSVQWDQHRAFRVPVHQAFAAASFLIRFDVFPKRPRR